MKRYQSSSTSARHILADNIYYFRLQKNWSQEELAFQLGTLTTYISDLENAKRNTKLDYIERIANVFEIPIDQLFIKREIGIKVPIRKK